MKLGIVIYSNDPETVWNAFRLANFSLNEKNKVKIFLLAKGVDCESIDTEKFNVTKQLKLFVANKGQILACGSCLKIRHSQGSQTCPLSSMQDLYNIIQENDKIITF